MLVLIIYCFLLIYAIVAFKNERFSHFIVSAFLIASKGLGILPEPIPLKSSDIFMFLCCCTLLLRKGLYRTDNKINLLLKLIISYYIFNLGWTILLGIENVIYSMMVLRLELYLLIFFVFQSIPLKYVESSFEKIFYLSIIGGIFYYLQFIGISGILQQNEDISMGIYSRLNNIPICTDIIIYYLLVTNKNIRFKYLFLIFFIGMVVLSQNRGQILAVGLCSTFVLFYKKQEKKLLFLSLIFVVVIYSFLPIIMYRFSSEGSTGEGIIAELKSIYDFSIGRNNLSYDLGTSVIYSEGTGVYRALLIKEKIDYLLQDPLRLLFGIGSIHEMSQACTNLPFVMGGLWDNGKIKKIDTSDVAFLSHIVRYGIIYFLLFIAFIKESLISLWHKRNNDLFLCCFLLLLDNCLQSFNGDRFSGISLMFIPLLIISQVSHDEGSI